MREQARTGLSSCFYYLKDSTEDCRAVDASMGRFVRKGALSLTGGLIGMAIAAIGLLLMVRLCASITKENFDRALAKEVEDNPHA